MPLRALARVNLAAIERNCGVLPRGGGRRGAVRRRQGRRLRPRRGPVGGRGARRRRVVARGRHRERGDGPARWRASRPACSCIGAISPEELPVALAADADLVAWTEEFAEAAARRAAARQARHRDGPARHARRRAGDAARRARERRRADDALRDRGRARRRLPLRAAGRLHRLGGAAEGGAARTSSSTPPTAPRRCASRAAHFDLVRCGIAVYGLDPFHEDPREHGARAGALARVVRRGGEGVRAGRERRLRAPVRGGARDAARDAADRLRRRRPARADQQRRRPRSAGAAGRSSARSRWTTSPSRSRRTSRSALPPC